MFHRITQSAVLPPAVIAGTVVLLGLALPAAALASSAPKLPTPVSETTCSGSVKPAPIAFEPNLLSYQFQCDEGIIAYTIVGNRPDSNSGQIDDFDTTPLATSDDGVTPDSKTSWLCEGSIPANGFNCTAGLNSSSTALSSMAGGDFVQGTLDLSDPYCGTPAATGKKQTYTKKVDGLKLVYPAGLQQALLQVVVTDWTGAQDGPFVLNNTVACHIDKPHKHHRHSGSGR